MHLDALVRAKRRHMRASLRYRRLPTPWHSASRASICTSPLNEFQPLSAFLIWPSDSAPHQRTSPGIHQLQAFLRKASRRTFPLSY